MMIWECDIIAHAKMDGERLSIIVLVLFFGLFFDYGLGLFKAEESIDHSLLLLEIFIRLIGAKEFHVRLLIKWDGLVMKTLLAQDGGGWDVG